MIHTIILSSTTCSVAVENATKDNKDEIRESPTSSTATPQEGTSKVVEPETSQNVSHSQQEECKTVSHNSM